MGNEEGIDSPPTMNMHHVQQPASGALLTVCWQTSDKEFARILSGGWWHVVVHNATMLVVLMKEWISLLRVRVVVGHHHGSAEVMMCFLFVKEITMERSR
jgi:hypothetical protein